MFVVSFETLFHDPVPLNNCMIVKHQNLRINVDKTILNLLITKKDILILEQFVLFTSKATKET
jgi:hypothetical protein